MPEGGRSVTAKTGCEPGLPGKPGQAPRRAAPASSLEGARERFGLTMSREFPPCDALPCCPGPLCFSHSSNQLIMAASSSVKTPETSD